MNIFSFFISRITQVIRKGVDEEAKDDDHIRYKTMMLMSMAKNHHF